jgi:hypothetical protein
MGNISNNLPDNQDRLLAYADYQSRPEYAGWLKIVIPALSMLDDLIYGSARMISDFPDMSYRSHGDALTGAAVKSVNSRNETYIGAASGGPRKRYSRGGRSLVAAQSGGVVTVTPGVYQTPILPIESAVTSPSNIGHDNTTSTVSGNGTKSQTKTCLWSTFPDVPGTKTRVTLKFNWSLDASVFAEIVTETGFSSAEGSLNIDYSTDGGSNWTSAILPQSVLVSVSEWGSADDGLSAGGSESINLPSPGSIDITQIRVRDRIFARIKAPSIPAGNNTNASVAVIISGISLEVETETTPPVISNVAAGSITPTSATITWTTNENSDSQVEYGPTTAYGQSTTLNPALVTAHSQGLSGLTAGTIYHYRVKSRDAAGNLAVSGDFTFTTAPDTTPPTVASFSPAAGATNVSPVANMTVTFSEAMDAATVNGSTVELRDPLNALAPATVSYNAASFTATLAPSAPLSGGITYTARVRGASRSH